MPVSVVVGGQFGSEGKGKVAHWLAKDMGATFAVRVGGSNSGHTVVDNSGKVFAFRHLPTASILSGVTSVIGPGSYINPDVLLSEIAAIGLPQDRLVIDPNAVLITEENRRQERDSGLVGAIGSTGSGTGAAVISRVQRGSDVSFVRDDPRILPYVRPTQGLLRAALNGNKRVVVEGTQGFGLSLLHSDCYPKVTSRDTTAAAFISEAGLSPLDVDDIVMVIRAFPIRVAGDSGPLPNETSWEEVMHLSGSKVRLEERTTVTQRVRRVAHFDLEVVRSAIGVNAPTRIALNHVDYVDAECTERRTLSQKAREFVSQTQSELRANIDLIGTGPCTVLRYNGDSGLSIAS